QRVSERRLQPSMRPQLLPRVHRRCLSREELVPRLHEPRVAKGYPQDGSNGQHCARLGSQLRAALPGARRSAGRTGRGEQRHRQRFG
ncbi:unnamed protein product, partial [Ectocarpus fasciculatus]